MIGNELKAYDGLTSRQQLNLFRNLYYNDGNATEYGIIANAINDCFAADVVPKIEVEYIFFELARKLNQMLPFKALSLINGEPLGNSLDLGKERALYEVIEYVAELKKKHLDQSCNNCARNKDCEKAEHFENYRFKGCKDFETNRKDE